jgi:hypothetical protein
VGRNVSLQIIRGIKANMPTLAVGELFWATDVLQMYTGSTSGNRLVGPLAVYNAAGTLQTGPHIVSDVVTVPGGGTITVTLNAACAFTSASSYQITAVCTNAKHSPQIAKVSGTQFTVMSAGGDIIAYHAIGN